MIPFSQLVNGVGNFLGTYPQVKTIVLSIIIYFSIDFTKKLILKSILSKRAKNIREEVSLKKKMNLYARLVFLFFLIFIWFSKIQALLISLVAVTAAIVLAFKEVIMCFTGGLLVAINKHFKEGDRIEIDGISGFVLQSSLSSFKVLEVGPEKNSQQTTGNIVTVPNSLILSKPVKNESYFKGYSIKSFKFTFPEELNSEVIENFLLEQANTICSGYIEDAKKSIERFSKKEGIEIPSISPRVKILINEKVHFLLKMPVKNSYVGDVEQILNRNFLKYLESAKATVEV